MLFWGLTIDCCVAALFLCKDPDVYTERIEVEEHFNSRVAGISLPPLAFGHDLVLYQGCT